MTSRTDEVVRNEFARRVMNDLALTGRSRDLVASDDGTKAVVFALDHELLSEVLHRARVAGERVNLFVHMGESIGLAVLTTSAGGTDLAHTDNHFDVEELHDDIRMGMFMAYALATGAPLSFAIRLRTQSAEVGRIRELQTT